MPEPNTSQFQIKPAFAVPMVFARMDNPDPLNQELERFFEQVESQGNKFRNPDPFVERNSKLYESNFTLFEWQQPCVQKLKAFCLTNVYRAVAEMNGFDDAMLRRLHISTESWFHITHQGGFFGAHNHAMHSWSGVYCVRHDGDNPESSSGRLTFINPHAVATMFIDTTMSKWDFPYNIGARKLRLTPGQLVLFPSWLLHEVLPYEGNTRRITVAFNARFRLQGIQPPQAPHS